jgi:hypothetical protein
VPAPDSVAGCGENPATVFRTAVRDLRVTQRQQGLAVNVLLILEWMRNFVWHALSRSPTDQFRSDYLGWKFEYHPRLTAGDRSAQLAVPSFSTQPATINPDERNTID